MLLLNRKAYTLSQFVLLWVLGVLFVILVCLNVIRYRATAQAQEAEVFMQQIRAEQEDRCILGRKYAVYNKHLKAFSKQNKSGTHAMRYDLSSGHGITAHHKLLDFHLQMPSYADGRICCDDCQRLNHYYSPCNVLKKRKDFIPSEPDCTVYKLNQKGKKADKKTTPVQETAEPTTVQPTEKSMSAELSPADVVPAETTQPQGAEPTAVTTQPSTETLPSEAAATETTQPADAATEQAPTTDQPQTPADAATPKCKVPAKGEFFIDGCEVYQAGAHGSVVHTWNESKCAYEISQNCMVPARWKRSTNTQQEKGLYPSDLDTYCEQLLKSSPCPAGAAAGRECGNVDSTCYKDCKITQQTEVRESALIVLYDVEITTERLQCMPARDITVTVP